MFTIIVPCIAIILLTTLIGKYFFNHEMTWKEGVAQVTVLIVILGGMYGVGMNQQITDTEVLNGEVIKKYARKQNCKTGWNDYTDSFCSEYRTRSVYSHTTCTTINKVQSCTTHYKTQYKYIYPWEKRWYVRTSFDTYQIKRVDKQGAKEPSRWTKTTKGDPASITHTYDNYMKIAYDNIINPRGSEYLEQVPPYPTQNYDYYKSSKLVVSGKFNINKEAIDLKIRERLKEVGPKKQANIIVLLTNNKDSNYRYAVESKWLGGKKNDIIVVIGGENNTINWVDIITLGGNIGNEIFTVKTRDAVLKYGKIDNNTIDIIADKTLKHFDRKEMKDFEYLLEQITPTNKLIWLCYLVSLFGSLVCTWISIKYDIF